MDEKKNHEEARDEEVKGARGLLATEDIHHGRDDGCDGGRHGKARHEGQRKKMKTTVR